MKAGVSITEIPLVERKPEIVERFQPALVGGGALLWKIAYHDSKFDVLPALALRYLISTATRELRKTDSN